MTLTASKLRAKFEHDHRRDPELLLLSLAAQIGLQTCELPFVRVLDSALDQRWTRDPFDRLIVGQAAAAKSVLVTKDAPSGDTTVAHGGDPSQDSLVASFPL